MIQKKRKNVHKPDKNDDTIIIDNKYKKTNILLGTGLHSYVYDGIELTSGLPIAVKNVLDTSHEIECFNIVKNSIERYSSLNGSNKIKLPNMLYYNNNYIILEKYEKIPDSLPVKDVLLLALSLLDVISLYHFSGIFHRDIKPSNILRKNNEIYLIDFSISCNSSVSHSRSGTSIFMSLNTHNGKRISKNDDLIMYAYSIIHILKKLPWEKFAVNNIIHSKEKYKLEYFSNNFKCNDDKNCKFKVNGLNECSLIKIMHKFFSTIRNSDLNIIDYNNLYNNLIEALKSHEWNEK